MSRRRTTARVILLLLLLGVFAGSADGAVPKHLAFPVIGNVTFEDDFGDPRWQGRHQGNDILARWRAPAVAAERGRVEFHQGSGGGTCMLYLHGASGTTYVYIHLNNDLTVRSEDSGGCRPGVAYAPGLRSGDRVRRGQLIGYAGDSGDAEGIHPHVHFEIRVGPRALNPYRHLVRARVRELLYPAPGTLDNIALGLRGRILSVSPEAIEVRTTRVYMTNGWRVWVKRDVAVTIAPGTVVSRRTDTEPVPADLASAAVGERVTVRTLPFVPLWPTQLARPGVLATREIVLRGG